ncbi:hypothetical protein HY768_10100 [candidate division TA06 bacterium]|uniref:Gliding motility protein SprA N-terminal domain-containing protein n=1 Tax=candidate division TA06 bacterium TaxID=2250710 RepID=A0A933MIW3_UNCT6|nr:hypothetical protein [candidate division TA06 bacterium]
MKPLSANKTFKLILSLFLVTLAGAGLAWAQEPGSLDSLTAGFIGQPIRDQNIAVKDSLNLSLNAMLELEMYKDFPLSQNYNTLEGVGLKRRQSGLSTLWRQNNADFLAKPAADRSGEGLIPDINVSLPGIGKLLGSGAQIKISGSEKITIGGQQTDNYGRIDFTEATGSFALKIKQEQQVNLEGIIGERLHVLIDWNSEALTDKKSKIRLYYEGKEDEILQRLEAGDTEFSLVGASLIGGLTTQHKGLFGLKGVARLGGLELTAIASKDEGQGETKSFVGQSQQKENKYNDKDFIAHRFFWIPLADPADSIADLRVYVNSQNQSQTNEKTVNGLNRSRRDFRPFYGLDTFAVIDTSSYRAIEKKVIEEYGYERIIGGGGYLLSLEYGLQSTDVLMVAYKTKNERYYPDSTIFKGASQPNLAVIKPGNCRPPDSLSADGYAWNYEFRNFYNIGSSNIVESSLSIKVKKRTEGLDTDYPERDSVSKKRFTYLMDLSDSNGVINFQNLHLSKGYFYFNLKYPPYLTRPFDHDSLRVKNPAIYDSVNLERVTPQYQIVVGYLTKEAVYMLDVPGQLIEEDGTVQVTIGGETVPSNQYTVDYETGTITFAEAYREKVIQAGTGLKISYQYLPWASFGTKTLAGLRGIYKFSEQAQLGGTWLYRSEQSLETKPRLGEEPARMIVAGLDGFYKASPGFLTTLVNYLPGVETEAVSSFEISAEAAANFPNPNTKGEVFLDDMDGAKLTDGLSLLRQGWVHSSIPADPRFPKTRDQLAQRTFWYNPETKVTQGEINPAITDENLKKDQVTTLKLHHEPDSVARQNSWTGITQLLSKNGIDLSQSKLLNVWVRTSSDIRLHIDFGREISRDQVWRDAWGNIKGRPDTVDAEPLAPGGQQIYVDANDIGLDSVDQADAEALGTGDAGNDDFVAGDSTRGNGTEGNGIYDTEDLKLSGKGPGEYWKQSDSYYTFAFNLSGSSGDPNPSGWRKFSVPLDSASPAGYQYGWGNIYYARVWVDSCAAASAEVELALVEISGNRWQEKPITAALYSNPVDSSEQFHITVKNNKDDADYLPPPNAVETENGRPKFEQSLALKLANLKPGHLALAQRNTNARENNYTGYKKLKIWVKGRSGAGQFLVRLASNADSSSPFYQYTGSLSAGWQELSLTLEDLSSLKKLEPDARGFRQQGAFTVKGTPNLASIGALYLGALNQDTLVPFYSDEVWFDNLRLDEVRRDRGTAVIANIRLGLADLLSLSLGYNRTDAYWYTMDRVPALSQDVSYSLSGNLQLDKFYLNRLGLAVPVRFGASLSESYPWYGGDDRKLTDQESSEQMNWSRGQDAGISLSKNPSRWWLTDFTIDRMTASLAWSRTTFSNRQNSDSNTTLNTGINWGWGPKAKRSLGIKNWLKLYYLPSGISFAVNNNRIWRWNLDKQVNAVSTAGSGLTRGGSAALGWQIADPLKYSLTTNRNLLQSTGAGELARRYGLGAEVSRTQSVDYHTTLSWLKIVQPTFNYSATYNQANRAYLVPGNPDSSSFLDVSNANNLSLNANLEIAKWLVKVTALRNEARDDSTEAGTPLWLVIQLEKMLKKMDPLDLTFSQSKTNSSSGLKSRPDIFYPDIFYQLGWRRKPRSAESYAPLAQERAGITNNYSASTGGSLGQLSINAGWQRNDSWTWEPNSAISSQATTWPDLRTSLNSVERMFKGLKILTSASLSSNYSKREDMAFQAGRDRDTTRWNISRSFSPMISLNTRWKKQVSAQASFDYSTTDSRLPSAGAEFPSGWQKDYSRNMKVSASGSYSFSAPQGFVLNLWKMGKKRFKFKSDLNLGLQTNYSNTVSAPKLDLNEPVSKDKYDSDKTEISISPNATYNFTRNIKGELSGSYTSSTNKIIKTTDSRSYSLNATVTVTF